MSENKWLQNKYPGNREHEHASIMPSRQRAKYLKNKSSLSEFLFHKKLNALTGDFLCTQNSPCPPNVNWKCKLSTNINAFRVRWSMSGAARPFEPGCILSSAEWKHLCTLATLKICYFITFKRNYKSPQSSVFSLDVFSTHVCSRGSCQNSNLSKCFIQIREAAEHQHQHPTADDDTWQLKRKVVQRWSGVK